MSVDVLPDAAAWSHEVGSAVGVLVLHGFTGNPSSVRALAESLAGAGYDVELPRLPGHGTVVDDLVHTTWNDWTGEAGRAYERLAARVDTTVVVGQSMGGSLALWLGLNEPGVAGIACVNPATVPQPADVMEMLGEFLDDGMEIVPGATADIADPDVVENSYTGIPIRALQSFMNDGLVAMVDRYVHVTVPLRLFTSRQDHVVPPTDSEHLAAHYGGPVEHTWLERSYHVATQDYDLPLIAAETIDFVRRIASSASDSGPSGVGSSPSGVESGSSDSGLSGAGPSGAGSSAIAGDR